MKQVNKFDISKIQLNKVVFAITSPLDYSMNRIYVIENTTIGSGSDYGAYLILRGWHCSCFDFEETEILDWEATELVGYDELSKFFSGWYNRMDTEEKASAEFMFKYDDNIKLVDMGDK